jgi:uncharacterized protein (DUF2336 family)
MAFEKGRSGNPSGRPKRAKLFETALMMELKAAGEDMPKLRDIARALIDKASTGDIQAINAFADRMDGKVPQAIIGDDDEDPVNVALTRIERHIVKPESSQ